MSEIGESLSQWRLERNEAFRTLNVDHFRKLFPDTDEDTLLLALHKARYDCTDIEDALRHESGMWLRARGSARMTGTPILPAGELPR